MAAIEESPTEEKLKNGEFRAILDPIHGGIKLAEMGSFIAGGAVGYVGTSMLLANPFIAFGAAIGLAIGSSLGLGTYLKKHWPSGRELVADTEHIAITKHGKNEIVIDAGQHVNVLTWYFEVKKDHPRARKGWYLLGLDLEQEESNIIVYSALPVKEFEKLPLAKHFSKLERTKNQEKGLDSATGMRRAGEQRRLYEAEVLRQMDGGDMDSAQFVAFLDFLQAKYPQWMIS
jgi:hypothetical protein